MDSLKYVVILALISSFQILCTGGRQIKSVDRQEVVSNEKDSLNEMPKKSSLTLNRNIGEEAASSHFTPSSNHNTVSVRQPKYTEKEEMPMSTPKAPTSSIGFHDSGIGHHLGATSGLEHSVTANTDDFRPTAPGHSPGIGHSYKELI